MKNLIVSLLRKWQNPNKAVYWVCVSIGLISGLTGLSMLVFDLLSYINNDGAAFAANPIFSTLQTWGIVISIPFGFVAWKSADTLFKSVLAGVAVLGVAAVCGILYLGFLIIRFFLIQFGVIGKEVGKIAERDAAEYNASYVAKDGTSLERWNGNTYRDDKGNYWDRQGDDFIKR